MKEHQFLTVSQKKEKRRKLREKYPKKIPIIVKTDVGVPKLDKEKFLVPKDLLLSEFCYVVRSRMKMDSQKALLLLANNKLLRSFDTIEDILLSEGDPETEFLYITACAENTFGMGGSGLTFKGRPCCVGSQGGIYLRVGKKKKYLTPKQRKQVKGRRKGVSIRKTKKPKKKTIKGGSGYDSDGYLKKWYSD